MTTGGVGLGARADAHAAGTETPVEGSGEVEVSLEVGRARLPLDTVGHPGDLEPLVRHALALGADAAGLGLALAGRALLAVPLPVELASVASLVDNEPRLRRILESRLGAPTTDLGLAVVSAVSQGLSQGPLGLVADGVHRVNLLLEASGRRDAWERLQARGADPGPLGQLADARLAPAEPLRPVALPGGPVERYVDRSALIGAASAAVTLLATRSARRAASMGVAAIPKAPRLGREAFAAHLDRVLCQRDLLVVDPGALRRLDRVDTVIVDGSLLATGRGAVSGLCLLGDADAPEVQRHLSGLFDPADPLAHRVSGRWTLGAPTPAERRRAVLRRAVVDLDTSRVIVVRCAGRLVAVAGVATELSSPAVGLIRAARRHGHMVVLAGSDGAGQTESGLRCPEVDLVVPGGKGLAEAIRGLQADGCVVALVAAGGGDNVAGLRSADVALELPCLNGAAWSGDILLNEVDDAALLLDAIASARDVSRQSVVIGAVGSGSGALLALAAEPRRAASMAAGAGNVAALVSMANGIRTVSWLGRHGGRVPAVAPRWHKLGAHEVLARLASTPDGLSQVEAGRRQRRQAGVVVPEPSLGRSILAELANPLTPILAGGAAASAAIGSPVDGAMIALVSALNALVGGVQRFGAERAIVALSALSQTSVTVLRHGEMSLEAADRLVPGDVVALRAGDSVPADCRVLEAETLEVDESSLTGESDTVIKGPAPIWSAALAERTSMLYEGSTVVAGTAIAVVVATGADTVVNESLVDAPALATTVGVEARLKSLTTLTFPVVGAAGAAVLGLGLLHGRRVDRSIGSAVSLAVAAVPEGLPILATMSQLASARRLSGRRALVRNPRAIEALGRVGVLCTDKTGTLTEGRIRLRSVSDGTSEVSVEDLPAHLHGVVAAGLRASPLPEADQQLPHRTDEAVVLGAARCGIGLQTLAPGWVRLAEVPFESTRGYHAVAGGVAGGVLLSVKGAPETVIPRCAAWRAPSGEVRIDRSVRRRLDQEVARLARKGMRILAVAESLLPSIVGLDDADVVDLTLLGLLVLSDPVRPTAARAVADLRSAGVEVLMVTGDHPSTAEGVAAELGILNDHWVVTGTQLAALSDAQLDEAIPNISVFARVTPADKVRVVQALQRRGSTVAMTGDGANDAAAIRLADVGIALGDHATAAARRAADLVVTDERIETIVEAIVEGRGMWASMRDALAILLGGNLGEVAFTVAGTAVGGRAPLSPRQLLLVNLLTDVAPALAVALRPPSDATPEALLAEGPDISLGRPLERVIVTRAASTALGAGTAWAAARLTGRRRRAGTTALVALVGSQLGQTIAVGGHDPLVLLAGLGSAALLAGIVQTPGVSQFFGCTPLGPLAWSIAAGSSALATITATLASP